MSVETLDATMHIARALGGETDLRSLDVGRPARLSSVTTEDAGVALP